MIITDSFGVDAASIEIPTRDGHMPAFFARPVGAANASTILVVQEIFGLHEHIRDVCRRFAKAGFMAVAPELYARQGDASQYNDIPTLIREVVAKVPDEQVMGDLDAAAQWAAANGGSAAKLGVTGFCWGGRIVWMYAAHNPRVKAGVAWYGPVARAYCAGDANAIDEAARIKAPMLGLYGADDTGIPVDTVEKLRDALVAAGNVTSEFVIYPGVPHAFFADYRPSYRREAAEEGWRRAIDWFARHVT